MNNREKLDDKRFTDRVYQIIRHLEWHTSVVFLDNQHEGNAYIAADPVSELSCFGNQCRLTINGQTKHFEMNPWDALREFHQNSWIFGYLGYDLKNYSENLQSANPDDIGAPDLWMISPGILLKVDFRDCRIELIKGSIPEEENVPPSEIDIEIPEATLNEKSRYLDSVAKAKVRISEGDYYEINISRRIEGSYSGEPFSLYSRMKDFGPVPFAAYLNVKNAGLQVCCASPERFLMKKGNRVVSEPIKGTAPASGDPDTDRVTASELLTSEKNRAENLMIVDLVRHDLNRICRPGSVTVEQLFDIRMFKTVLQMTSVISGEPTPDKDAVDIIRACFPMGSMTGAPKISAMQDIEKMEYRKRGIYSGAIGYISPDQDFDFNVVIRTAICKKGKLYYDTGGAITSDSDPEEEWEETIYKSRALTKAVSAKN